MNIKVTVWHQIGVLILGVVLSSMAYAQQQNVSGTVNAEQGRIAFAKVVLNPGSYGAVTDETGNFTINNVPVGKYSLTVVAVGYDGYEQEVTVGSSPVLLTIQLVGDAKWIDGVDVLAKKNEIPAGVNKMDVKLKDLPITVHSVNREVLDQRGANDLGKAMENVTGVRPRNTYGGFQHFQVRGMEQFVLLVDGVRDERHNISQSAPSTNLAAVEGIDVLKGPSSVLFGHSALGGIINVRRKQPTKEFTADFSASYGSFNTRNIKAGTGGAATDKLTYRVDLGMDESDGFRGLGHTITNGYLSMNYQVNDKHRVQVSVQANDDSYTTDTGLPVLEDGTLVPLMDPMTRYNDPQDFLDNRRYDFQVRYEGKLNENLKLSNQVSYYIDDINYFSTESLTINATQDSLLRSFPFYFNHQTKPFQNQLELSGKYSFLGIENKFVVGHSISILDRKTFRGSIDGPGKFAMVSIVDPVLNQGDIFFTDHSYQARMETVNGFFGQNWINVSEKVKAMVAVRLDAFSGEYYTNQVDAERNLIEEGEVATFTSLVPTYRGGIVYQPTEKIAVYSSYNNYFKPTRRINLADGTLFDPEFGYQGEVGFRYEFTKKASVNVAGFYLARTNILENFGGGVFENVGTGTSKGVEVDLQGEIVERLKLSAGYAYAFTNVEENRDGSTPNPHAGNRLRFAPEHIVNFWGSYELKMGLGFGTGVRYNSANYTNFANTLELPEYTVVDAAVWYNFKSYQVKFNLNNITDTFYYRDAIFGNQFFPGTNRNFLLTFSMRL